MLRVWPGDKRLGRIRDSIRAAEPAVAADGAGIRAFCDVKSLQPAPRLNLVVRPPEAEDGW